MIESATFSITTVTKIGQQGESMEHRIGMRLVFSASLLSICLAATAYGQRKIFVFDTGMVTLGPNQILRISGDGVDQDDVITLRFRRIQYSQGQIGRAHV